MLKLERKAKEDMIKDQEKDISIGKIVAVVRKEIETAMNEMDAVVESFNTTHSGILDGYKKSLKECQESLLDKESLVEELRLEFEKTKSEVENISSSSAETNMKNIELLKQYNAL